MNGRHTLRFNDYDGEASSVSITALALTAANLDAEATKWQSLIAATETITKGLKVTDKMSNEVQYQLLGARAVDEDAQRERKWLVRWQDAVNFQEGRVEIPCADLSYLDPNARGYADLNNVDVAAFVTAFEAIFVSPAGGGVSVLSVQHVGRNT